MVNSTAPAEHPVTRILKVLGRMVFAGLLLGFVASTVASGFLDADGQETAWVFGAVAGLVLGPFGRMGFGNLRVLERSGMLGRRKKAEGRSEGSDERPASILACIGFGVLAGFIVGLIPAGLAMLAYFSWGQSPWGSTAAADDQVLLWIVLGPTVGMAVIGVVFLLVVSRMSGPSGE